MIKIENSHRTFLNLLAAAGILLSIIATGCSATVESQPEAATAVESDVPMPASVTSFLGPEASKLAPGITGAAALVRVGPNIQWATYDKILLDPAISVVVPQARALNLAQSMATDRYAFVGSAEVEMKATDSVSGELFAAAVDQPTGGMGLKGATSLQWGDAQYAMDYWAQTIPQRLNQFKSDTDATAQSY